MHHSRMLKSFTKRIRILDLTKNAFFSSVYAENVESDRKSTLIFTWILTPMPTLKIRSRVACQFFSTGRFLKCSPLVLTFLIVFFSGFPYHQPKNWSWSQHEY